MVRTLRSTSSQPCPCAADDELVLKRTEEDLNSILTSADAAARPQVEEVLKLTSLVKQREWAALKQELVSSNVANINVKSLSSASKQKDPSAMTKALTKLAASL